MVPKRSATTHTEQLGDEASVYEWTRTEVHALNATAARIWHLCDGVLTDAQIAEALRRESQIPHADDVVRLALAEFSQRHLLEGEIGMPSPSRRALLIRLGKTAALLPVVTSIVAPTPVQAQSVTGSMTFNFTGAMQTFTVPLGVASVVITAQGAEAGTGGANNGGSGLGGLVTGRLTVTAGSTLNIFVGGQGGAGTFGVGGTGGFNGGGVGGPLGGGGGGASDVRRGGVALADRIIVAGGGGGAGGAAIAIVGGGGGGTTGQTGNISASATGGGGGTQVAGGAGGTGLSNGAAGALGIGGAGAGGAGGGGGGGGYYGGGGGGAGLAGGGGGGGSSFTDPTATAVSHQQAVRAGSGQVVITW